MKTDKKKIILAMARACMNTADLTAKVAISRPTVNKVIAGKEVRPRTIGRIAAALEVDVTEILIDE